MAKILIIDDEASVCQTVSDILSSDGHECESLHSGIDALQLLSYAPFELIVLDWGLPDLDGPSVCDRFRTQGGTAPVLMLTGRSSADEAIVGLSSGADDYLRKPFHGGELRARVQALLRRPAPLPAEGLQVGNLRVLVESHKVLLSGQEVHVQPKEFRVLELLIRNPGIVFSLDQIIMRIWGSESDVSFGAVRQTMTRLRSKLETAEGNPIKTVHGVGYTIEKSN